MIFRKALVTLAFASVSSIATAQMGTPEEQAACRPDVRKFCYKIPRSAGNKAFQNWPRIEPEHTLAEMQVGADDV
jgi:hypothetical protein